jgi:hypothetical protein
MRKTLLSVSLWILPAGCSALLDLGDVQIVDGGSDDTTDGMMGSSMTGRMYRCGYATPGNNCDNRRRSHPLVTRDMTAAIAACKKQKQKQKQKLDFCYVKDDDGLADTDESQCRAASGSWRPDSNCCQFRGRLGCPANP